MTAAIQDLARAVTGLDLAARYGVKTNASQSEGWAVVAGVTDPSGVLWRFAELAASADGNDGPAPDVNA